MAPPTIKLSYFDLEATGEPTRLDLILSGTPFEDDRVPFSDWPAMKPTTPYGALPLLTIDGGPPRTQSMAMLRYVGATYSETLYPKESLFDIEEALGVLQDMGDSWQPCVYMAMRPENFGHPVGFNKTDEGKQVVKEMREKWIETKLPMYMKYMADMIDKHGGTFLATKDAPSIADCVAIVRLRAFVRGFIDHVPITCLDGFPKIKAYMERIYNLPEIKGRYDSKE